MREREGILVVALWAQNVHNNWRVETLHVHYRDRDFLVAADVIIIASVFILSQNLGM